MYMSVGLFLTPNFFFISSFLESKTKLNYSLHRGLYPEKLVPLVATCFAIIFIA